MGTGTSCHDACGCHGGRGGTGINMAIRDNRRDSDGSQKKSNCIPCVEYGFAACHKTLQLSFRRVSEIIPDSSEKCNISC